MRIPIYLYVTRAAAIEAGMTHEGRLFGCPAWLRVDSDEEVIGTPKVPLLHLWCLLIDGLLVIGSYFIPPDRILVSLITIGKPIA